MVGMHLSSLSFEELLAREWLTTNGLGGFASSSVPCLNTRKYHGLLVAPLSPPVRQTVILSRVEETVVAGGKYFPLSSCEYPGTVHPQGHHYLRAFSADPFPRWAYQGDGWTIEKQLRLLPGENTVCVSYTLLAGSGPVQLEFRPLFALRGIHELMYQWNGRLVVANETRGRPHQHHRIPATNRTPEAFFAHDGEFNPTAYWYLNTIYRNEQARGYAGLEDVWMPGTVTWMVSPGKPVHFACSTDPIDLGRIIRENEREDDLVPAVAVAGQAPDPVLNALTKAASQFVVAGAKGGAGPAGTRIVAGYPWLPPSGRDGLIAMPGLLLVTGRLDEAKSLLQSYAAMERRGLMPSDFPWDGSPPRYLASDVSLWFVNAVWQYLRYGGDAAFVERQLLPVIGSIVHHYRRGTELGIHVDDDGLLVARQPGQPTTWMDAKSGDWAPTPRYGRAVEVNALWFNALRIGSVIAARAGEESLQREWTKLADRARDAFDHRFWNHDANCCYDVVDGPGADSAIRPNQLLAISLPFSILSLDRHARVLEVVGRELLTPVGVRTLSPHHPQYAGKYRGYVDERDRAYHQGTAYPWLLGPYVTAALKVRGRSAQVRAEAGQLLEGCFAYMRDQGVGQVCELFDGSAPHRAGGVRSSARSVGELIRCYVEDVLDLSPAGNSRPETTAMFPQPGTASIR